MSWVLAQEDFEKEEDYKSYVEWCQELVRSRESGSEESPRVVDLRRRIEILHKQHYDTKFAFGILQRALQNITDRNTNVASSTTGVIVDLTVGSGLVVTSESLSPSSLSTNSDQSYRPTTSHTTSSGCETPHP